MELTLIIIKPDGVKHQNLIGERLGRAGMIAPKILTGVAKEEQVRWLYRHLLEREGGSVIVDRIVAYFTEDVSMAAVVGGPNAVAKVRQLVGDTDPMVASPGTIRADCSSDSLALAIQEGRALRNVIHASSSLLDATEEVAWLLSRAKFNGLDAQGLLAGFKLRDEETKLWLERAEAFK